MQLIVQPEGALKPQRKPDLRTPLILTYELCQFLTEGIVSGNDFLRHRDQLVQYQAKGLQPASPGFNPLVEIRKHPQQQKPAQVRVADPAEIKQNCLFIRCDFLKAKARLTCSQHRAQPLVQGDRENPIKEGGRQPFPLDSNFPQGAFRPQPEVQGQTKDIPLTAGYVKVPDALPVLLLFGFWQKVELYNEFMQKIVNCCTDRITNQLRNAGKEVTPRKHSP